ncbi:hypothetical protein [Flavobacterium laiguense]|uniref:hypothetical protein n=1 Tax=Flavobacterium laiguense TaxID=2169409 RepID=UPI0016715F7F|nr:hypothetical protein [Flavobacterium laiguense]
MKKFTGIVGGLKTFLKYGVYIMAIIKIVEFAISTLDEIGGDEKVLKEHPKDE